MPSPSLYLSGFGTCVPEKVVTNFDMERLTDTNDEWITTRTGIRNRHFLAADEQPSDLAVRAAQQTLANTGVPLERITHTIVATCTPEYLSPSTACVVAQKLGLRHCVAFDINAACTGFVYALNVCQAFLCADPQACILLVTVEGLSRRLNWKDRSTCVLFGDGAGASLATAQPLNIPGHLSAKLQSIQCSSDTECWDLICVGGGTHEAHVLGDSVSETFFVTMQGREVFKHAVRALVSISLEVLNKEGLSVEDVDLFIPHQANLRIIEAVGSRLGLPADKVFVNVGNYGNTSASSIPLAMADAFKQGRIKPGMKVLVASFGSGFTWGAAVLQF
ncbi:MAG TPA: ketoacyl-ACP synthase III [Candidatus Avidesulfovibrio excrementigallinarum]|nr:ketoacyl-ACP synthase III [Candidatus Avidesulfovibrio excrementigallinarum]